jgi:predicted transport protein
LSYIIFKNSRILGLDALDYAKERFMTNQVDPQLQAMIDNMPQKTGKSIKEWFEIIAVKGPEKHGDIMKLLKGEHGITHGYANTISILYRQQATGGPPPPEDLVSAQYAGPKEALRPVYEAVLAAVQTFGDDVEIASKKTYLSLRRSKQFAIVQASTRTRVDLGLNLKGVEPGERLEGGNVFSGMCTHRVRLESSMEVDDQVKNWLKQAYEQA